MLFFIINHEKLYVLLSQLFSTKNMLDLLLIFLNEMPGNVCFRQMDWLLLVSTEEAPVVPPVVSLSSLLTTNTKSSLEPLAAVKPCPVDQTKTIRPNLDCYLKYFNLFIIDRERQIESRGKDYSP